MIVQVFDPPMCCASGVCGPAVDPGLVRVAADLEWLRSNGVEVVRYSLSQQPAALVATPVVKAALSRTGTACLPLTVIDGAVVCEGRYPTREMLARFAGLPTVTAEAVRVGVPCCGTAPAQVPASSIGRELGKGSPVAAEPIRVGAPCCGTAPAVASARCTSAPVEGRAERESSNES